MLTVAKVEKIAISLKPPLPTPIMKNVSSLSVSSTYTDLNLDIAKGHIVV